MDIAQFIPQQLLILTAALYIIGVFLKKTPLVKDWMIPWVLMVLGIGFSVVIMGISGVSVLQGIMCAFTSVGTNQLIKQSIAKD